MRTRAENKALTNVGPEDTAGRLLREYWHPICPSEHIADSGQTFPFELLGERLVAYRTRGDEIAVVPERCPHRGASLQYGYVENRGLRCAYHGWLFAPDGRCIERPFEHAAPSPRCNLPPYQAREVAGLIFVSLRPSGPPPFPMWDILARTDVGVRIDLQDDLECNWLQIEENAADVTHTVYLHSRAFAELGMDDGSGFNAPLTEYGFQPFEYGLVKSWRYRGPDGGDLDD